MQRIRFSEEYKDRFWASIERQRSGYYSKFNYQFKKALNEEAEDIAKISDINKINRYFEDRIEYWDILLEKMYISTMQEFGNLGKKSFEQFIANITFFSRQWAAKRATLICGFSKRCANKIITQGLSEALTTDDISRNLRSVYKQDANYRAMRMARTEVVMCSNYGNLAAAQATEMAMLKVWVTARDERVRDWHANMDGEAVNLEEEFSNGLSFPGDPNSADPSEVINCRCVCAYETKR